MHLTYAIKDNLFYEYIVEYGLVQQRIRVQVIFKNNLSLFLVLPKEVIIMCRNVSQEQTRLVSVAQIPDTTLPYEAIIEHNDVLPPTCSCLKTIFTCIRNPLSKASSFLLGYGIYLGMEALDKRSSSELAGAVTLTLVQLAFLSAYIRTEYKDSRLPDHSANFKRTLVSVVALATLGFVLPHLGENINTYNDEEPEDPYFNHNPNYSPPSHSDNPFP